MNYELYVFGSAVRGEVEKNSDIDMLAIIDNTKKSSMFPDSWSVYTKGSIKKYFSEGKLFAWHLYLDAKCIYQNKQTPFIEELGNPSNYQNLTEDFYSLKALISSSLNEIKNTSSEIFEVGVIYTALRDIAMVASTKLNDRPCFSRYSPYRLPINFPISKHTYDLMIEARLTSTRGIEFTGDASALAKIILSSDIKTWLNNLEQML